MHARLVDVRALVAEQRRCLRRPRSRRCGTRRRRSRRGPAARRRRARAARPCRRAIASDASRVCRAGNARRRHAVAQPVPPVDEELDAGPAALAKRVWFAAPSSPNCGAAGSGSWTTKCAGSAKIARSTRVVVGASSERWKCADEVRRREVHEAVGGIGGRAHRRGVRDPHRGGRRAGGEQLRRVARGAGNDFAVVTGEAERRNAGTSGRSCGGSTACGKPRAASARILASPCNAASRGLATCCAFFSAARLPRASPA